MMDAAWSGADQFDPMGAATDEFRNLIDFDNLDLDFSIDYAQGQGEQDANQQLTDLADSLHVQHLQSSFSPAVSQEQQRGHGGASQHGQHGPQDMNNFFEFNMSHFSQPQDNVYRPHAGVPPTPNSIEMHGDPGRYLQQMDPQQAVFDHRFHMTKDDATFTPLVSPAVTPHEARFRIPDYTTVPGSYFSPLTSPALNAQSQHAAQAHSSQYNTTSGSSTGTSPVDVDMDMLGEAAMPQPEPPRRLRSNKRSAPRASSATTRVRQSPSVKPNRRKATVSSLIPPKEVSELMEEARAGRLSSGLEVPRSRESSEADSISPEPLSEMGPPPKPASVTYSPAIVAQGRNKTAQGVTPATPASLMRIHPSPTFGGQAPGVPLMLDDLTLPEASLERPSLTRIETAILDDDLDTPRLCARKTPKIGPLSTPSAGAAMSGRPSPMLSAVSSPTSPALSQGTARRGDQKPLPRNTKKRNSVSSNLVSPVLRPKFSPSIKPLLPDGGPDDTHALLLATKSNYQNILDGTTVPGVVYPSSLSTNLTSKRTSHKIAEQGRRNRINTALLEMQALLPSPQLSAKDAKEAREEKAAETVAQSNNSKAAKVESAIEYIKQLQKEVSDKDKLLGEKDQEMETLRKELAAWKRKGSVSSTTNEAEVEAGAQLKAESISSPDMGNAG